MLSWMIVSFTVAPVDVGDGLQYRRLALMVGV
jgi:hypothetical protein